MALIPAVVSARSRSRYQGEDGRARVTYDLPSTVFGYVGNPELTELAHGLDAKLTALVEKISGAPADI